MDRISLKLQSKRIIFLGNMNNLPFYFANEFKNKGYDITFVVDVAKKNLLDRPESWKLKLKEGYPDWIKEIVLDDNLKAAKFSAPLIYLRRYISLINSYDIVFLNGFWISLAKYVKPSKKVVAVFGGFDLDVLADYERTGYLTDSFYEASTSFTKKIIPRFLVKKLFKKIISQQREGIRRADIVNYYPTGINPAADELLNEIKKEQEFSRLELRGFDCNNFPYQEPNITNRKFTILNITRFFYLTERNDNKRNDIMIKGIGRFLKQTNVTPNDVQIIFFEKGDDLEDAKKLCDENNISPFISWKKQVSAENLNDYFANCDVAFDQLGNQWVGAGLFSMLTGRPLIANGRPDVFEKLTNEKSPICQANNENDVANWLIKLYNNRQLVKEIGLNSNEYVKKHFNIDNTIKYFLDHL